ncbi:hypothetical protein T265_11457 [Opisthorchis viverrini]|uniref:Uncharacterized protein n=1 Tax=Opisthorchis viverrini TaxID=6198 RepID=A0A074ZXE7_OPIVI|nr:hypothetical protein T265_11457 [Opisthorchis viverrini]KER19874.1 hypothetical protein T265_11457 [Opisthorchis viverrini]
MRKTASPQDGVQAKIGSSQPKLLEMNGLIRNDKNGTEKSRGFAEKYIVRLAAGVNLFLDCLMERLEVIIWESPEKNPSVQKPVPASRDI